jgi:hypothetical protein
MAQLAACLHSAHMAHGHAGRGPLLCGLAAHNGGSGPRPRDTPGRCAHGDTACVLGNSDFTDAGGGRLRARSGGGFGEESAAQRAHRRRDARAARFGGDSRRCGDLRRRRRAVSGSQHSVKTRRHSGLPGQRQG